MCNEAMTEGEPYAETPALRARNAGHTLLLRSVTDYRLRLLNEASLRDRSRSFETDAPLSFLGTQTPDLNPLQNARANRIVFGNEVGDPLFQEFLAGEGADNRTPMMDHHFNLPVGSGEIFGGFLQVDHFSDRFLAERSKAVRPVDEGPQENRAWFGQNLPQRSMLVAGAGNRWDHDTLLVALGEGWTWQTLSQSGWELPFRTRQAGLEYRGKYLLYSQRYGRYLLDTANATASAMHFQKFNLQTRNLLWGSSLGVVVLSYSGARELGAEYAQIENVIPFVRTKLFYSDHWILSMNTQLGASWFSIEDTLSWFRKNDKGGEENYMLGLSWRQGVDPDLPATVRSPVGRLGLQSNEPFANVFFTGREKRQSGALSLELALTPWMDWNLPVFQADTLVETPSGLLLRSGKTEALNDVLIGLKVSLSASMEWAPSLYTNSMIQLEPLWTDKSSRKQLELIPPLVVWLVDASWWLPSGLVFRPFGNWQLGPRLQGWGEDYLLRYGWEWNLEIRQNFANDKIHLWISALNIFSENRVVHPNGGVDRFRMMTGLSWTY